MKSSRNSILSILVLALALYICGAAIAAKPDKARGGKKKPVVIKLIPTKMPVFEGKVFTDDDKKFHSWLTTFWPENAKKLKALEKKAKAYQTKFHNEKRSDRRLWKGYKLNAINGQFLVEEVKLRLIRIEILDKYMAAKTKQQKTKLHGDLTNIVSKEFDITVTIKKYNYHKLRRKISRMRNDLARRERDVKKLVQRKDLEIKKRIKNLINGENEGGSPVSGIVIAAKPDKAVNSNNKPVVIKLKKTTMPAYKDKPFTDDDKKFHSWLTTFWPDLAQDLKDVEKNAKAYRTKFNHFRNRFVRLWKGYRHDPINGQYLVEEVMLRHIRIEILDKYTAAKTKEQKAKLLGDLTDIVSKEFDIGVTIKKHKYNRLRKRIDNLTNNLAKREGEVKELVQHKNKEIKKRVQELIKAEEAQKKK
ncbi:MAG: hypothetical protein FVQ82_09010 [Planctomycetes bacterium]|nr:hypothetical protein [Planctomycetota bacterium]